MDSGALSLNTFKGNPGYIELHNVVYNPNRRFLVDLEGRAVKESGLLRGQDLEMVDRVRGKVDAEYEKTISAPCVFFGHMSNAFGHFLTEGLSRAWFLYRHPEIVNSCMLLYQNKVKNQFLRIFEQYDGRFRQLRQLEKKTLLKKVYVPLPAFCNRSHAYTDHLILLEQVGLSTFKSSEDKGLLYLSRSKLPPTKRIVKDEKEIENAILKKGGRVYFPEQDSFERQVRMINQYDTIVGPIGSAFHLNLFRVSNRPLTQHILTHGMMSNYRIIDKLKGFEETSHYYRVCKRDPQCKKLKTQQNVVCDLDRILTIIEEL